MGGFVSKKFNPATDLPLLHGKVILVTGGNAGIGYATVKQLARRGAKVYLAARNESKATAAISNLEAEGLEPGNGEIVWHKLDLSDPRLAKKSAEDFIAREKRLDVLINNAALLSSPYVKSFDGIVDQMMVNLISPSVFTKALLPLLIDTAKEPGADVRIVNLSSNAHRLASSSVRYRSIDDINIEYKWGKWGVLRSSFARYCATKFAFLQWSLALQTHLASTSILVLSAHPGFVDTFTSPGLRRTLVRLLFRSPDGGAHTPVIAAAAPHVRAQEQRYRGAFLTPVGQLAVPSARAREAGLVRETWETVAGIERELGL